MKRYVPFTSVSIDPEIQRMRDILANGGYVDDDGSLYNDREATAMNQDSLTRAKAVPKTVVSFFGYKSDEKKIGVYCGDSEGPIVNSNRTTEVGKEYKAKEDKAMKKIYVPFTSVSTVESEIERMRAMLTSREDLVIDDDGTIGRANDPEFIDEGSTAKAKTVPKAIVSVLENGGSIRDLINEMRGEDVSSGDAAASKDSEIETELQTQDTPKKTSVVPKGIVSARSVSDLINEMRADESTEEAFDSIEDIDDISVDDGANRANDETQISSNPKIVPKTVVSVGQWYERNPELLKAEKAAMYDYKGKAAKFHIMEDGSASWLVSGRPRVPSERKCANCSMQNCKRRCVSANINAKEIKCRKYDLLLLYDSDHPQVRYGSSVKTIPLRPSISEMQEIVNRTPRIRDKRIPHLLRDSRTGQLYLCSADTTNVSTDLDSPGGVTSAATSLRFAFRWINAFEVGLIDDPEETWAKFQRHGEI